MKVVPTLIGIYSFSLLRADMDATRALAERVHAATESDNKSSRLIWGHFLRGVAAFHSGNLCEARDCLDQAIGRYDQKHHATTPQDPGTEALGYAALTRWHLGMADSARHFMDQAVSLAERLRKPYALAHIQFYDGYLSAHLREPKSARKRAESVIRLAREQKLPLFFDAGRILLGWALAGEGLAEEGMNCAQEGMASYMASGNRLSIARFLGLVAEAQALAGALDEARSTIEEALNAAPDQVVDLPYALWLRGELLLGGLNPLDDTRLRLSVESPVYEQAVQSFRDSILTAHQIGAKSYALRAATSLARLQKQVGTGNANETIHPILSDFVEGFDTRDLVEAKALVEMK